MIGKGKRGVRFPFMFDRSYIAGYLSSALGRVPLSQ